MADFPKPPSKSPQLVLPSKAHLIAQAEEREKMLQQRSAELAELEKQLREEQEQLEAKRIELETKSRALVENEMLLKNQKLLYQKQFAQMMEQKELAKLRDDLQKKEEFLQQTEKRLNAQFSARERELDRREAWVSAEHEKATLSGNRRLHAIVFTDVVSYSALMQADEGLTIQKVRADMQRMQAEGKAQGGMLINTMGDGMLMIFPSAIQAVRFSLGMQRAFNLAAGADTLRHRFGIHIADVALLPDGGIAGDGVNIASRLESKAPAGGICLSAVVYALVKGKLLLPPSSMEEVVLKNIAEPMPVHQYTAEAILAMVDPSGTTPQVPLAEEERTIPPFAFSGRSASGSASGFSGSSSPPVGQ
jgi:class 3 adenylate cyclase